MLCVGFLAGVWLILFVCVAGDCGIGSSVCVVDILSLIWMFCDVRL